MSDIELGNELPDNYEQLKSAANRTSSWKDRLAAVEELGQWKHVKIIDVLKHRMNNDLVYSVQEAAFRKLQQLGEDVQLPPKRQGEAIGGITKILVRIKKSLPKDHSFEAFKEKLQKMRSDIYDTYEGDKGADFEKWLENKWAELSIR
ncbi:HEAT repeat domain-containing protein [Cohnella yongneupensis]|uniref:HEAT repeat domain-containing protein n=1 Tax=Cohnella yongneupensis TaxID=425006 RepID=A0ABW0QZT0_9BACL